MPLKIILKPGERMVIDGAVIRNGDAKIAFTIENRVPLLREKDILTPKGADTVCRKIYYLIQLMYIDKTGAAPHHAAYWKLVHPLVEAVPSSVTLVDRISKQILAGEFYKALKLAKILMAYEEEVMNRV
jgi:flagellar protein FlbT